MRLLPWSGNCCSKLLNMVVYVLGLLIALAGCRGHRDGWTHRRGCEQRRVWG